MNLFLIFIIIFIASMTQGATGFGFAILAMPFLSLILSVKDATVLVLILAFLMTFIVFYKMREHVNKKLIKYTIIAALIGRFVGIYILESFSNSFLELILGITLISLSLFFKMAKKRVIITPSKKNGSIAGVLSGILGGMFNISGPPLVLFYLAATENKNEYQASLQLTFLISIFFSIFLHLIYGNIDGEIIKLSTFGIFAMISGTLLGLNIFKRINLVHINNYVYYLMMIMGVFIILNN